MGESVVLPYVQGAPPPRPPELSPPACKADPHVPGASPQRPPQLSPPAAKGNWHSQGVSSPSPMEINTRDLPENFRVGVIRKSQESNVMLVRPMLGKVRQVTMKLPAPDFVYGMPRARDPEGAREVVGYWMEHIPNYRGKPGPDFKAMNAAAVRHYAVCPHHQRDFRRLLPLTLKHSAQCRLNLRPELPSDTDPQHTYGRKTSCRPLEELRITGGAVPMMKLIQNSYADEWIKYNLKRQDYFLQKSNKPDPDNERNLRYLARKAPKPKKPIKERFILSRFKNVPFKVDDHQTIPLKRDL